MLHHHHTIIYVETYWTCKLIQRKKKVYHYHVIKKSCYFYKRMTVKDCQVHRENPLTAHSTERQPQTTTLKGKRIVNNTQNNPCCIPLYPIINYVADCKSKLIGLEWQDYCGRIMHEDLNRNHSFVEKKITSMNKKGILRMYQNFIANYFLLLFCRF